MSSAGTVREAEASRLPVNPDWRPDIQGLRAIAVITVVVFHAGLPLPGGFVGVDMFFVISGYVITAMLAREQERSGRVSFRQFYVRRIKRLTPALALMVGVTVVAAGLFLSPFGVQQDTAATGIGAMLLAANAVISSITGGYFDAAAETNPLLHTWSLSVEEQFYLVFPLLLALAWRLSHRRGPRRYLPLLMVALVGLISVLMIRGAFVLFGNDSWLSGFYSPITRAWEFAAGALIALIVSTLRWAPSKALALAIGSIGLILLALSLVVINDETPFPGKWTFLPVAATVLLIAAGLARNPVSQALSRRGMVLVGDLSYSIYLWHWPFIVFAAVLWPETSWAVAVAAVASLAPAVASYRWVEQPIRSWRSPLPARAKLTLAGFVVVPIAVAAAVWAIATHITAPAYQNGTIAQANPGTALSDSSMVPCDKPELRAMAERMGEKSLVCLQSRAREPVTIAILGDSHARHLAEGLSAALPNENFIAYTSYVDPMDAKADRFREAADYVLGNLDIQTVVIANYWQERGIPEASLRDFLGRLTANGKRVVLVDDVPNFPFDSTQCQYRKAPVLPWVECAVSASTIRASRADQSSRLAGLAAAHPGVVVVPSLNYFCDAEVCRMNSASAVLYQDNNHLNVYGSQYWAASALSDPAIRTAFPSSN